MATVNLGVGAFNFKQEQIANATGSATHPPTFLYNSLGKFNPVLNLFAGGVSAHFAVQFYRERKKRLLKRG